MNCCKFGWNWRGGSGEEDFLILSMYFRYFVIISSKKKSGSLYLNKFKSPLSKNALCQVWLNLAHWFWRRRFFKYLNVFSLFRNYIPLEKDMALHLNKFESLYPRMLYAKFGLNWHSDSGEEDFLISLIYFSQFCNHLPLEKGVVLHLNALHPRMHCCKFGWNWAGDSGEEDFLNAVNVISLFCNYLPFGKGNGPLFDQKWIPFYQGCIMPSLLKIGPVVLEKK